jgi:P27 family predicted phage terminase small subunit
VPRGSGRRPKPSALKKLQGNPGKRKLNHAEPKPAPGDPVMPRDLPLLARAEWKVIVPELRQMGVLAKIDAKALAAYCHAFARWMEAEKSVRQLGIIVMEPIYGLGDQLLGVKYKKNPAVTISEAAVKIMKAFLVEFGMTPSSRSRIRVDKPQEAEEDEIERYLRGRSSPADRKHVN